MLETIFYSSDINYRTIAIDIYTIFFFETILWYIVFNFICPYEFKISKIKWGKYYNFVFYISLILILRYQWSIVDTDSPSNDLQMRINTEILSFILGFLYTQAMYNHNETTIFRKKIRKKEIRWFTSKK